MRRRHEAAAPIYQRPFRFGDQLRRPADLARVAFGEHLVPLQVYGRHRLVVPLALKYVLGDIHQHRPGRPLAAT